MIDLDWSRHQRTPPFPIETTKHLCVEDWHIHLVGSAVNPGFLEDHELIVHRDDPRVYLYRRFSDTPLAVLQIGEGDDVHVSSHGSTYFRLFRDIRTVYIAALYNPNQRTESSCPDGKTNSMT